MRNLLAALCITVAMGCSSVAQHTLGTITPNLTHYYPPLYSDTLSEDGSFKIIGVDKSGSPIMDRWNISGDVLRGFAFNVNCAAPFGQPVDPPWFKTSHTLRAVFRGSQFHAPFDSLRGSLEHVEQIDGGPYAPTPVADSLGSITGGAYAFQERGDTLSGIVTVRLAGIHNCKCLTPTPVTLIRGD